MNHERVLVVAAHPDDEVLGCGGTIVKHRQRGDSVAVLIMAEGITSRSTEPSSQASELLDLHRTAERANRRLGVNELTLLRYPDNRMDTVALLDVVKDIEVAIGKIRPTVVYTHHASDVNIDHRVIHDAVIAACRPLPGTEIRQLLFFEVPSSTEWRPPASRPFFAPNWYVNIHDTLEVKLDALDVYASEMREFPHPRSRAACEHLARWRGATVGVSAAEAFELGRVLF